MNSLPQPDQGLLKPAADTDWLCTCKHCGAARHQLRRCLLKRERLQRSERVLKQLELRTPQEFSGPIVEKAVGILLRRHQEAGLGPTPLLNIVFDLGLRHEDKDRIAAILDNFARKGWVLKVSHPRGARNPTIYYKLAE